MSTGPRAVQVQYADAALLQTVALVGTGITLDHTVLSGCDIGFGLALSAGPRRAMEGPGPGNSPAISLEITFAFEPVERSTQRWQVWPGTITQFALSFGRREKHPVF
jgi:hypothetical protein